MVDCVLCDVRAEAEETAERGAYDATVSVCSLRG